MGITPLGAVSPERWALVEQHRERLLGIAHARCENPADAEDCVQEAMLRVATFADLDEARVGQLLTTVVIRLAVDTFRIRARTARVAHKIVSPATVGGVDGPVCDEAEAEWLAAHARQLPAIQRDVITARATGASWDAIARDLGTSFKTVESAASRARAALRAKWWATAVVLAGIARRLREISPQDAVTVTTAAVVVAIGSSFFDPTVDTPKSSDARPPLLAAAAPLGGSPPPSATHRRVATPTRPASVRVATGRDAAKTLTRVSVGDNSVGVTEQPTDDPDLVSRALRCDYSVSIDSTGAGSVPSVRAGCKES